MNIQIIYIFQTKREVAEAMSDLKMFKSNLEENEYSLKVIEQILIVSINLTNDGQNKLSLTERIKNMQTVKEILTNNEDLSKLDVYKHLMREYLRLTDVLHSNCIATWRKQIEWLENDTDSQESWRMMLKITSSQEDICDSVFALQYFDSLNVEIKLFADKLINLIVKPIIIQKLQVDVTKTLHISTMSLKVSNNKDEFLSTIIKKLKTVFEFMNSVLPVEIQIMSYLGSYASQKFCDIFKDLALFNAVPVKYNKMNDFREELNEVLEFNTYLSELGNIVNVIRI